MGGNLIGGLLHARDLICTDELVKAYHTGEKIMMTIQLAEKCGINATLSPSLKASGNKAGDWGKSHQGFGLSFLNFC